MAQRDQGEPGVPPVRSVGTRRGSAVDDAEERLRWYATYGRRALWSYRILALAQLAAAALVPVLVAAGGPAWLTAACGGTAAVLTGAQQVLQVGPDSLRLGSARVAVDRELRLYRAHAGPYSGAVDGEQLLAERVEAVVATETTTWASRQHKTEVGASSTTGT